MATTTAEVCGTHQSRRVRSVSNSVTAVGGEMVLILSPLVRGISAQNPATPEVA
ncbi:hypothetical protein [Salinirubrum litoreum]|uniref:Uncharacterized protein n=1 Tax=Salinirubrum litoreum TaxID=1126234 RepID=A0ABD5RG72_9EURY|nr:hypothetical protein [Salinirubrum litoreum]